MSTQGPPVVRFAGVGLTYPGPPPVTALCPTDLIVRENEYIAVVGPSGSGKSTLLNVLGLLDRPTQGRYELDGHDVGQLSEVERTGLRGARIGFVFQAFHLLAHRSATENVALAQLYAGVSKKDRQRTAVTGLRRVSLGHRLHASPTTLSGGERQRVAIARALSASPSLLLCDEPTGNLDSVTSAAVLDLIGALHADGMAIVLITHDPAAAARADRVLRMNDGTLTEEGHGLATSGTEDVNVDRAGSPSRTGRSGLGDQAWSARRRVTTRRRSSLPGPRPSARALLDEALAGTLQRRGRTMLTALGTVLGVGALVAVLGLTATATGQISSRFTALAATQIRVDDNGGSDPSAVDIAFPGDADARVRAIPGVVHAGVWWTVPRLRVAGVPLPGQTHATGIPVNAASPDLLRALGPTLGQGRLYDEFHDQRAEHVAVLGSAAARQLGITNLAVRPAIFIDDMPFMVVGILDDVTRNAEVLLDVLVPRRTAQALWGPPDASDRAKMLVETRVGAAQVVADQIPLALRPDAPSLFTVVPPPDPRALRDAVSTDLGALFVVLAGVCLVIGAVGIANTTMVAVLERVAEIGLRRALGARPRHIAGQFLVESATTGTAGGLAGASLGLMVVVIVAVARQWTPIVETWTLASAPLLGTLVGLTAGAYPAIRAARIEPVEALRR